MKSRAIYLLPVALVIVAILLYVNWGRVDTAMLKSSYTSYCINAELDVDSCGDWANTIVFEWPDQAQECSDLYPDDTDLLGVCVTGFMLATLEVGE